MAYAICPSHSLHRPEVRLSTEARHWAVCGSSLFASVLASSPSLFLPQQTAHDIGEALQNKLERLPEIERAFVHLDYEVSHRPEHHPFSSLHVPAAPALEPRSPL